MSIQKTLCLICETPTADGAILAAHVDKDKLQTWFLNVCGFELDSEEIKDDDLICCFCLWHAEFQWKFNGMSDETLVWWNLDLDDAAKELRKHYFQGNIEQCCVQLEEVDLPESEEDEVEKDEVEMESETQSNICSQKKKCLYCGKLYKYSYDLSQHVRKTHKNAVRCENHNCATYFHTIEAREKHNEEVHEKPKEQKIFKCEFCNKDFIGNENFNHHVRRVHREYPVKCAFYGCVSFFKTKIDMGVHFDSFHRSNGAKLIDCDYCDYKTSYRHCLEAHTTRKHKTEKPFKCDKCGEMFSTKGILATHMRLKHVFKRCKICILDVSVRYYGRHIRKLSCDRCKNEFQCSGLYQSHLKKCRKTLLKCCKCPKSFQKPYLLIYHMKIKHGNREWRGLEHKALGFKCEPCKRYYKSAKLLKQHYNSMHNQAKLKHCAHCPKSFYSFFLLKNHLAEKHNLLELKVECDDCKKQFISKYFLRKHLRSTHLMVKVLENCKVCGKSILNCNMKRHLLIIHGVR